MLSMHHLAARVRANVVDRVGLSQRVTCATTGESQTDKSGFFVKKKELKVKVKIKTKIIKNPTLFRLRSHRSVLREGPNWERFEDRGTTQG